MKKRYTALFLAVLFLITGVFVGEQQAFAQRDALWYLCSALF